MSANLIDAQWLNVDARAGGGRRPGIHHGTVELTDLKLVIENSVSLKVR